jgi:hypothetical protein
MPANPLKIDGTAAETAVPAAALSNPAAVASLPMTSGVKKRETTDAMSVAMTGTPFGGTRLSGDVEHPRPAARTVAHRRDRQYWGLA